MPAMRRIELTLWKAIDGVVMGVCKAASIAFPVVVFTAIAYTLLVALSQ
jgi:hypothetical protein